MKAIIFELLLFSMIFFCFSACKRDKEEYAPIYYPEGTSWKEIVTDPTRPFFYQIYRYDVREDTIIDGDEYKKVYVNAKKDAVFFLHEKGKQVFYYDNSIPSPIVAYDFNWKIGCTVSAYFIDDNRFYTIDTIRKINRIKLTEHQVYEYIDTSQGRCINTIGFVDQPLFPYSINHLRCGYVTKIMVFERERSEIYRNHDFDYLWL